MSEPATIVVAGGVGLAATGLLAGVDMLAVIGALAGSLVFFTTTEPAATITNHARQLMFRRNRAPCRLNVNSRTNNATHNQNVTCVRTCCNS